MTVYDAYLEKRDRISLKGILSPEMFSVVQTKENALIYTYRHLIKINKDSLQITCHQIELTGDEFRTLQVVAYKDCVIEIGKEMKNGRDFASVRRVDLTSRSSPTVEAQFSLITD